MHLGQLEGIDYVAEIRHLLIFTVEEYVEVLLAELRAVILTHLGRKRSLRTIVIAFIFLGRIDMMGDCFYKFIQIVPNLQISCHPCINRPRRHAE